MKIKINILKISIMAIMVILGLTAIAPEWLELKDMIIKDQVDALKNTTESISHYSKSISDKLHLTNSNTYNHNMPDRYEGILSSINYRILGSMSSLQGSSGSTGLGVLFALPFWLAAIVIIYALFFTLNYIVYSSFKKIGNPILMKYSAKKSLTHQDKIPLYVSYFCLSLGVTLWLWFMPLIVIMIVVYTILKINTFTPRILKK